MNGPTGEVLLFEFLDGYEDGVVLVQDTLHASATFLVQAMLKRSLQGDKKVKSPLMRFCWGHVSEATSPTRIVKTHTPPPVLC